MKSAGGLVINAPVGAVNFVVGTAIDAGKGSLELATKLIPGVDFEAGRAGTTAELIESFKRTGQVLKQPLVASAPARTLGTLTPAGAKRISQQQVDLALPEHYMAAIEANQSILPFIVEDFGNISMAGSVYAGLAKATVRGVTMGEAAVNAERAAAARLLDESVPGSPEAAAAASRLADVDAKAARIARQKKFLQEQYGIGKDLERMANKVGALPFKPYAYGTRKAMSLWRDGVYFGPDGRYARWGAKAAAGYKQQAEKLVDEGVSPDDPRVVELLNKSVKANRRATAREVMRQVRSAKRDAENESDSAMRAVLDQIREPLHKTAVNPATGEAYGELSLDEVGAILAIQGGNAQIINRIATRYNLPPRVLALLGRYDFYEEYSLSENAAQLAYDYLNFDPNNPGRMTIEQYERLANAAENVAQTVFRSMIERASAGYGRRNPLPPEQLVPTPFIEGLERNILQSINEARKALRKEQSRKKPDAAEVARLQRILVDRENVYESWKEVQESGILELPVDHPDRIAVLKGFVDQLPIELALDPSMYSASMRVPLEFYRRIRRAMAASIIGDDGGPEVVPEDGGGGPRLSPARATKEGAVEAELSKRKKNVKQLEAKIKNIEDQIAKKEVQHAQLVERIVRYDIVDAFIAGRTPEQIASEYSISVEMVTEILKNSAPARTYARAAQLKMVIDELRTRFSDEEIASIPDLVAEVQALEAEAAAAQAEYQNTLRLAEEERRSIESQADRMNEELYDMEEELGDTEDAYERSGGVLDDIEDTPGDDFPQIRASIRQANSTFIANETKVGDFGFRDGGYWVGVFGAKSGSERRGYADLVNVSFAADKLDDPISREEFIAEVEKAIAIVREEFQKLKETEVDRKKDPMGKTFTTGTRGRKLFYVYIVKKNPKNFDSINIEDAVTAVRMLADATLRIYDHQVRIAELESMSAAPPEAGPALVPPRTETPAETPQPRLSPVSPENFVTPKSVIDREFENYGDTLPDEIPKQREWDVEAYKTGGLIKQYGSEFNVVNVNVAASYITRGPDKLVKNEQGLMFTSFTDRQQEDPAIELFISGNYAENKFEVAILRLNELRQEIESRTYDFYSSSIGPGVVIDVNLPEKLNTAERLTALDSIDLMIEAVTAVASGPPYTSQGAVAGEAPAPILRPVEPVAAEPGFTAEDAKNLVARVVHTDFNIEGVDIDNLAYKHWRTEPFKLDIRKMSKYQLDYIKNAMRSGERFFVHYDIANQIVYFTDGYVIFELDKSAIAHLTKLGIDASGLWRYTGKKNKSPEAGQFDYGDDNPLQVLVERMLADENNQPLEYLYRFRENNGTNILVYRDPVTGDVVALDEDRVTSFGPDTQFFYSRASGGKPGPTRVAYTDGRTGVIMPLRNPPPETPPTMVERMRKFATELRATKIAPKKTNYKDVKSIADAIEAALPEETPADVATPAVPAEPALTPPPAPKPKPLRPKATKPSEVKPDTAIPDPVVREAVYTTEVVDAMAAEAAAKMDAAQTAKARLEAFQEWIDSSKKYDAEVARMAIELEPSRNARAKRQKLEEKIAVLRAALGELPAQLETAEASVERIESNPLLPVYLGMDKLLPLDVALSGDGFPSEIGGFELPVGPEGEGVRLIGPMYYPSETERISFGGVETEVTRPGLTGYTKLKSENYRTGDRRVVFSLRKVALLMRNEIRRMVENERFAAIVAQFGSKASEILGEDFTQQLYEQAVAWVDNMPQDALYVEFRQMMADSLGEEMPISGIAAPGPGVQNQRVVREFAIKFRYGTLIGQAMRDRGFDAIDPFADIRKTISAEKITAARSGEKIDPDADAGSTTPTPDEITQETFFLPKGIKEQMLEVVAARNTGKLQSALIGAQKVTSFFKVGTLVFSIPWQLGDLISSMIISTMSGVDPRVLIRYMKEIAVEEYGTGKDARRRMFDPVAAETGESGLTLRRLIDRNARVKLEPFRRGPMARLASESGVQNLGASMQERAYLYGEDLQPERGVVDRLSGGRLAFVSNTAARVTGVSFKINETINKIARHAFFLEQLDRQLRARGQTLDSIRGVENWQNDAELKQAVFEAARTANEWLGDYSNLTATERRYFTTVFPFWAWIRHIHKVFDLLAVNHPESLFYYMYLGTLGSMEDEDPLNLRKGGFNVFGGVASSNWINPFADVFAGPIGGAVLDQDLRPFGSAMGPVPRLLGGIVGFDVARFDRLRRPAGTGGFTESGEQSSRSVLPLLGGSVGETVGFTAQQFPIVQRVLNINPTPFENIPGTRVALGNVARFQTGEARLSPLTGQRIEQPGGRLASILRLFGGPLVPYRSDQQINDVLMSARQRLLTLDELQRMRELQGAP